MPGPSTDEMLDRAIDNLIKLALLALFANNPDTIENVAGLALRVGCRIQGIEENLPALVKAGLIEQHGEGDGAVFTYTRDPALCEMVGGYFGAHYSSSKQRREFELQLLARGK